MRLNLIDIDALTNSMVENQQLLATSHQNVSGTFTPTLCFGRATRRGPALHGTFLEEPGKMGRLEKRVDAVRHF